MSTEVDRDRRWLGIHCDTLVDMSPQRDVNTDEHLPSSEEETTSGCDLNCRSPTPPIIECVGPLASAPSGSTAFLPEVKDRWSPGEASHRGSLGSVASDGMSDAWSPVASVPGLDDNGTEVQDGKRDRRQPEAADSRAIIVVSDSSPTPPPPNLIATSEPQIVAVLSPPRSVAVSAFDDSVVRKLESFVESMNVRRCTKPSTITWTDSVTSSTSGLGRQSFPVCRPLNGLRGSSGSGVLLPFYVPFKTSDALEHPLDLSSKTNPLGRTSTVRMESAAAFVQAADEPAEVGDDGVSSLESLQKQFGENSAMLERIGVRRQHAVSVVAPLAGIGAQMHGATSPLNGVGLYGPALNEPCVQPSCRPVSVPHPDGSSADGRCLPTTFVASRSLPTDRRSARRLVRGQDAWMNGVNGRQRRSSVLRCLECNMSFWSLPELTLHMIQTAHYANIVRSSVVQGPTPETASSPNMTSSCSPVDSDSSRESDVDNEHYFEQDTGGSSDFQSAKSAKRQRESSPSGDGCSKTSKIWRPDCSLPVGHRSANVDRPIFDTTSSDNSATPAYQDVDNRHLSGLEHDRAVTSSKSPEDRGCAAPLYDRSPGRSETSDDGNSTRQPALTAMEDFISRSICELDRGKRRPAMSLLPPPTTAPCPPPPPNGVPSTMTVADLMFPLFPLAQFFPEQFLLASRAFNFLPLVQSMARLYGDRFTGLDVPLGAPAEFPAHKTVGDDFEATRRPSRQRTPADVGKGSSDRKRDILKCQRINGGRSETKDRQDNGPLCQTSNNTFLGPRRDVDGRPKLSPTSSAVTVSDSLPSTALDSLRGFVYGDRQRSEQARADRKYFKEQSDGHLSNPGGSTVQHVDDAARRRPRKSPSVSSGADSFPTASSPAADVTDSATAVFGATEHTGDYDSRFDKYYRLARELAGQL